MANNELIAHGFDRLSPDARPRMFLCSKRVADEAKITSIKIAGMLDPEKLFLDFAATHPRFRLLVCCILDAFPGKTTLPVK